MSQDNINKKDILIQSRADTEENWNIANPILLEREIGYNIENGWYKIGDGISTWNELPYIPIGQKTAEGGEIFNDYENNLATGLYSHAEGVGTHAIGICQHVQGKHNIDDVITEEYPEGKYLHIVGNGDTNNRSNAHTLDWKGNGWYANGISVGRNSKNQQPTQQSEQGKNTIQQLDSESWDTSNSEVKKNIDSTNTNGKKIIHNNNTIYVGAFGDNSGMFNGKSQTIGGRAHAEGSKTIAFENNSHAEGNETFAKGQHSHAEGNGSSALENASHSEGTGSVAKSQSAHAEGNGSIAEGEGAHAEGSATRTNGLAAHAEGEATQAFNKGTHAEGYQTTVIGEYGHGEGYSTNLAINYIYDANNVIKEHQEIVNTWYNNKFNLTKGAWAHGEGKDTLALDLASHAEGIETIAASIGSHTEGMNTLASGNYSHAEGIGTTAWGQAQHVQGKYNTNAPDCAHIVGNGSAEKPSNAHTLDWSGNAWFAGDLSVGSPDTRIGQSKPYKLAKQPIQIQIAYNTIKGWWRNPDAEGDKNLSIKCWYNNYFEQWDTYPSLFYNLQISPYITQDTENIPAIIAAFNSLQIIGDSSSNVIYSLNDNIDRVDGVDNLILNLHIYPKSEEEIHTNGGKEWT